MNVERVITVKGELENMIKALEIIHQKIKSAFENDTKTFGAQAIMMGGIPPLPMAPPPYPPFNQQQQVARGGFPGQHQQQQQQQAAAYPNFYPPAMLPSFYTQQQQQQPQHGFVPPPPPQLPQQQNFPPHPSSTTPSAPQSTASSSGHQQNIPPQNDYVCDLETVYLYIPNVAVGAIIGTKGQFIKNIIKLSGASVKITPLSPEESKTANERQVVIQGSRDSQWKAQYYIYEKIRQERFTTDENIKLRAEIHVPPQIVGRIIGKSGKNVRELQRTTGATIKLPEDPCQSQSNHVVVRIHGTFNSSQVSLC
jgi:hypothetical protein